MKTKQLLRISAASVISFLINIIIPGPYSWGKDPILTNSFNLSISDKSDFVDHVAVSNNGRWLATGGQDGNFVWDIEKGKVKHRIKGIGCPAIVHFLPDSKHLLAAFNSKVCLWSIAEAKVLKTRTFDPTEISAMVLSGTICAIGLTNLDVYIINSLTFEKMFVLSCPKSYSKAGAKLKCLALDKNATRLAVGINQRDAKGKFEIIRIIEIKKRKTVGIIVEKINNKWHGPGIRHIVFSANGVLIGATGINGNIKVWKMSPSKLIAEWDNCKEPKGITTPSVYRGLMFWPNDGQIISTDMFGRVVVMNIDNGSRLEKSKKMKNDLLGLVFSQNMSFVVSMLGPKVSVWSTKVVK